MARTNTLDQLRSIVFHGLDPNQLTFRHKRIAEVYPLANRVARMRISDKGPTDSQVEKLSIVAGLLQDNHVPTFSTKFSGSMYRAAKRMLVRGKPMMKDDVRELVQLSSAKLPESMRSTREEINADCESVASSLAMYLNDTATMLYIGSLLDQGMDRKAFRVMRDLDTAVREELPLSVWKFYQDNY